MENLGDIKAAVMARGYEDDQDNRMTIFANDIVRDLFNEHRWTFAQSTQVIPATAGTGPYALADDVLHVESVRLTLVADYSPELTPVDADTMLELVLGDLSTTRFGDTAAWAETDTGVVTLWPAPLGGTLTVRYQHAPSALDADADVPPIPTPYFDIIVAGITQRLALRERQWDAADRFMAEYDRRVSKMKAQFGLGQRQRAGRVGLSGDKQYETGL